MNSLPTDHDPRRLGFTAAVVVVTLAWNIDWRHYIRYWNNFLGVSSARRPLVFRILFALVFLAACGELASEFAHTKFDSQDVQVAAESGLAVLGVFLALDLFFRWRMGRPGR